MTEGIKKSTFNVGVLPTTNYNKPVMRKRPEGSEEYMSARAEKLRELYEKMEPEYERVCTYKHPTDGRKDKHELYEVKEGVSPFELSDFEERMPKIWDYIK